MRSYVRHDIATVQCIARSDKTSMSISSSQPAGVIAIRYRLSTRYYLRRCSRKWREHPRDAFLTYRRRKWPTHPPYREVNSFLLETAPPVNLPTILRRSFRLSCPMRTKRLSSSLESSLLWNELNLGGGKKNCFFLFLS